MHAAIDPVPPPDTRATAQPIDARAPELLALLQQAVAILGPDGTARYRFPEAAALPTGTGVQAGDRPLLRLVHPDDRPGVIEEIRSVCSGERPTGACTVRVRLPRQGWTAVEVRFHGLLDHPDVRGVVVCVTSTAAAEREARLRALWERSPVALFETDEQGRCTLVNPAWCTLAGLSARDSLGYGWLEAIHPDDRPGLLAEWQRCVAGQAPFAREYRLVRPDGEVRWLRAEAAPLHDGAGRVRGYIGSLVDLTAERAAHGFLEASAERLRAILAASSDLVVVCDRDARLTYVSPSAAAQLGHDPEGWIGARAFELVHPDDLPAATEAFASTSAAPGEAVPIELRLRHADGSWRYFQVVANNLLDDPAVRGVVLSARDLSAIESAETRAAAAEQRFARLFDQAATATAIVAASGAVVRANRALADLLGVPLAEIAGTGLLETVDAAERESCAAHLAALLRGDEDSYRADRTLRRRDGTAVHTRIVATALRDAEGGCAEILVQVEDETERRALAAQLEFAATHDRLTGLANRALFVETIEQGLAARARTRNALAVLYVDLDRFKQVNDTLGHDAGDEVLRGVAARLRNEVRPQDLVARLGGDEFAIVCTGLEIPGQAVEIAHRVKGTLARPYSVEGREVTVGASVGVAVAGDDPVDAATLVARADAAAYRGKHNGRNRVEVYDRDLEYRLERRDVVRDALLRLAAATDVPLIGQPIVDLATAQVVGYQLDLDWRAFAVEPDEAEEHLAADNHSARAVGAAAMRAGVRLLAHWVGSGGPGVPGIAIRFPSQFVLAPGFVADLRDEIARHGVEPALVWVGIPAGAFTRDRDQAAWTAAALAGLGHGVALDGFGPAGAVGELRSGGFQTVVLAPEVHAHLADDPWARKLCSGVIRLAADLGLVVAARDVDGRDQLEVLRECGCQYALGGVFGAPLGTADLLVAADRHSLTAWPIP